MSPTARRPAALEAWRRDRTEWQRRVDAWLAELERRLGEAARAARRHD